MDTNTKSQTTDLIAQKTAEYDKLPGLILGLDGWILRSVPKVLRAQFLNGYEKLLKIVFHPDRYQETRTKESRQAYLQSVGEAVRFMLADEFAFEITSDSVPTKKNPIITLREAVQVRDNIIATIDERLEDKTQVTSALREEIQKIRTQLNQTVMESERRAAIDHQLKSIVRQIVKKFPVPIGLKYSLVSGCFINLRAESTVAESIGRLSSDRNLSEESDWITAATWIDQLKEEKCLESSLTLKFRRSTCRHNCNHYVMIGAMTIAHVCEFVRAFHRYPVRPIDGSKVMQAIRWLTAPVNSTEPKMEFHIKTSPFLLPYYNPKMILLMQVKEAGITRHRLFLVQSVDAGDSQVKAIADGLQRENDDLKSATLKLHEQLQTVRMKFRDEQILTTKLLRKLRNIKAKNKLANLKKKKGKGKTKP